MVLEVGPTAPPDVVVRSYRRLALKLHPDRNTKCDATEAFQLVCQFSGGINYCGVLKSNIEARTSLRDIEGRNQTPSV